MLLRELWTFQFYSLLFGIMIFEYEPNTVFWCGFIVLFIPSTEILRLFFFIAFWYTYNSGFIADIFVKELRLFDLLHYYINFNIYCISDVFHFFYEPTNIHSFFSCIPNITMEMMYPTAKNERERERENNR